MSPREVAALKQVHVVTVRRILRDEKRRAVIFPGAVSIGEGNSRRWDIPEDEAITWQPYQRIER